MCVQHVCGPVWVLHVHQHQPYTRACTNTYPYTSPPCTNTYPYTHTPNHPLQQQAYACFALSLGLSPTHIPTHLACAALHAVCGDHESTLRSLRAAWDASGRMGGEVQVMLGNALADMGMCVWLMVCCGVWLVGCCGWCVVGGVVLFFGVIEWYCVVYTVHTQTTYTNHIHTKPPIYKQHPPPTLHTHPTHTLHTTPPHTQALECSSRVNTHRHVCTTSRHLRSYPHVKQHYTIRVL